MFAALPLVAATASLLALPQQDARTILDTMRARQMERANGVENYLVRQHVEGMPALDRFRDLPLYFYKHTVDGQPAFGAVPPNEYVHAKNEAEGNAVDSDALRMGADAAEDVGEAMAGELAAEGVPLFRGPNRHVPGTDPRQMFENYADFLRITADVQDAAEAGDFGKADAAARVRDLEDFAEVAILEGTATLDGHETYVLVADGMQRRMPADADGTSFTITAVRMWVDKEHYVKRRTRIEGTATSAQGESYPLTLEWLDLDYRQVGSLYEPHRKAMRISGILEGLSEAERKQMLEARAQISEMEAQMDQMPAAARGMIEGQLTKAKRQLDSMAEGGAFTLVTVVDGIDINAGPPPP